MRSIFLAGFISFLFNQNSFAKNIKVYYKDGLINLEYFTKLTSHITKKFPKAPVKYTSDDVECYQLDEKEKLSIKEYSNKFKQDSVSCGKLIWINPTDMTELCFTNILRDHWYGAGGDHYWFIDKAGNRPRSAYVTGDINKSATKYGYSVIEPLWISSSGLAIFVDRTTPLFVRHDKSNGDSLCLSASYNEFPYNGSDTTPSSKYLTVDVCEAANVREISEYALKNWLGKPSGVPDTLMMTEPIWTTWAEYKKTINHDIVIKYANRIVAHNFSRSQLEIDAGWNQCYGDWEFNKEKFPDPAKMVKELKDLGFRTTLWLNQFVSPSCKDIYNEGVDNHYFIELGKTGKPALSTYREPYAIIDFTNPVSVKWFTKKLQNLRDKYGIYSFKFDYGEITPWLIPGFRLHNQTLQQLNPSYISKSYAESITKATGNDLELRVGFHSQELPIFVRMLDKTSDWSYTNGLKSLIPNAFYFGLYGYPFILPDMIGGNNYRNPRLLPDKELFIRWVEANALLPSMQFSYTPHDYKDDQVIQVSQKMIALHEQFADTFKILAQEAVSNGYPIIRPLWWLAPSDTVTYSIDDQFMLGDEYMVAPVVTKSAITRDVYLTNGSWIDQTLGKLYVGPTWVKDYPAGLEVLPLFRKANAICVNQH